MEKGKLEVITGCMCCGKTEELIRRARRASIANLREVIFKPTIDTRSREKRIVSRDKREFEAIDVKSAQEILKKVALFEVIGIDEVQFFNKDLIRVVKKLINLGKRVIISGLDTDFRGEPFEVVADLIARANEHLLLTAICMKCGKDGATRTQRMTWDQPAPWDSLRVMVGGDKADRARFNGVWYEARCLDCHEVLGAPD